MLHNNANKIPHNNANPVTVKSCCYLNYLVILQTNVPDSFKYKMKVIGRARHGRFFWAYEKYRNAGKWPPILKGSNLSVLWEIIKRLATKFQRLKNQVNNQALITYVTMADVTREHALNCVWLVRSKIL